MKRGNPKLYNEVKMQKLFSQFILLALILVNNTSLAHPPTAPEALYSQGRFAICESDFNCSGNDICELSLYTSNLESTNSSTEQHGFVSLFMGRLPNSTFDNNILIPANLIFSKNSEGNSYSITTTSEYPPAMSFTIGPIKSTEVFNLIFNKRNYHCTLKSLK